MDHSDDAARLVYETFYADEDVANDESLLKDIIRNYQKQISLLML